MKLMNCAAEEFIKRLNGRKVICFGAGTTLIQAQTENVKIDGLEEHIAFFIDNDKSKQGLTYEYCNRTYDIKSVEAFKSIVAKDYVILITCSAYADIYSQLKGIPETRDMDCYMYEPVCFGAEIDIENYFTREVNKHSYKDRKEILREMHLKDRHKNQRCFIIGNGPSLKIEDLELLKDEVTFAANAIYLCFDQTEWRPTYYFCVDIRGYGRMHEEINRVDAECRFVPYLGALMAGKVYDGITYYNRQYQGSCIENNKIAFNNQNYKFSDNVEEIVYQGTTVVYDAIQFAVYMGFSEIYLLGVDCNYKLEYQPDNTVVETDAARDHFIDGYNENCESLIPPTPVFAMKLAYQKAKEICDQKGIVIKNATRGGKLEVFERVSFDSLVKA